MDDDSIKPISNQGFFTYVFRLSRFKQEDLMNIVQYTLLSICPVILFVYFTKKYFPIVADDDSSIFIFIVTVVELIFMIMGIFFIDRIINYIPTFSGKYYETINLTTVVIIFILFMLIIDAGFKHRTILMLKKFDKWFFIDDALIRKLGGEVRPFAFSIDDIDYKIHTNIHTGAPFNNNNNNNKNKGNNGAAAPRVEQMTQQHSSTAPLPTQGPMLPNPMSNYGGSAPMPSQQVQNFNSMYTGPTTPLVNAAVPGGGDSFMEPMAANAVLGGGSSWSSW
jgi:hypothetical protein